MRRNQREGSGKKKGEGRAANSPREREGRRSRSELQAVTKYLDSVELQKEGIDEEVLKALSILHAYLPTGTVPTSIGQSFYRVRKDAPEKITDIRDLKSPPADKVKGYQRCNRLGKPMFYASDHLETALVESNVKVGDEVYLCKWVCRQAIPINHTMVPALSNPDHVVEEGEEFVVNYLRKRFIEQIDESFSCKYKLTACVAEFLSTGYPETLKFNIAKDGLTGFVYTSVKDSSKNNVALHPAIVDRSLVLVQVVQATVTSVEGSSYGLEYLDISGPIESSAINWHEKLEIIPSWATLV